MKGDHLEDPDFDGSIILNWIIQTWDGAWSGSLAWISGSGYGDVACACECGNGPSGSIKCGEFFDLLSTCYLLKKDSAPWS
jgi:hypothetical protein